MTFKTTWAVRLILLLTVLFPCLLNAQTANFELEISDRLLAFETARLENDHERILDLTYPGLFTLIPRDDLRAQLEQLAAIAPVQTSKIQGFSVEALEIPVETNANIFLSVALRYTLSDDQGNAQRVEREILAVRNNNQLEWYFLEVGNGQKALLSSILPAGVL